MFLNKVVFLCAPTYRSRAYAQVMSECNLLPSLAIYLEGPEPKWEGEKLIATSFSRFTFRPYEPALQTLENSGVKIIKAPTSDVNSDIIIGEISNAGCSIVVYSGHAGVILRKPILDVGKKFLHVHGGYLPEYGGSTAFYFSILNDGTIGASAIYLDEKIDEGHLVEKNKYETDPGIEIDRLLDPMVRADTLINVLREIGGDNIPKGKAQEKGVTKYHVIHPILKHIALRKTLNV